MINLKLAEYNLAEYDKDKKFERFLELGKDFGYFGEFIIINDQTNLMENDLIETDEWQHASRTINRFLKDEKDPLKRFNGLFNGRTYGDGRFVLVPETNATAKNNDKIFYDDLVQLPNWEESADDEKLRLIDRWFINTEYYQIQCSEFVVAAGNLHENPELYEIIR